MATHEKWIWLITGPNGAGKTTLLPQLPDAIRTLPAINLDRYADTLKHLPEFAEDAVAAEDPESPQKMKRYIHAGDTMSEDIERHIEQGESFSLETRLPNGVHGHSLQSLQQDGWKIGIVAVGIESAALAKERVAKRVKRGGHPIGAIREAWELCKKYFPQALAQADRFMIYDNSGPAPSLLATKEQKYASPTLLAPGNDYTDHWLAAYRDKGESRAL